jgi:hypothetical protein
MTYKTSDEEEHQPLQPNEAVNVQSLQNVSFDISTLNTRKRRKLTYEKLSPYYSKAELNAMVKKYEFYIKHPTVAQLRWFEPLQEAERLAKLTNERRSRKWSPEEDKFIRDTYLYLTDNTIALALNLPTTLITARRAFLDLRKKRSSTIEHIVWCERDNFERDLESKKLLKARPDAEL